MLNLISKSEFWQKEYQTKGIPSSFKTTPSGALLTFLKFIENKQITGKQVVDIGCGTGRSRKIIVDPSNKSSQMHEINYPRSTHVFILRRKNL